MKKQLFMILSGLMLVLLAFSCSTAVFDPIADKTGDLAIIPEPLFVAIQEGTFVLDENTALDAVDELQSVADFIKNEMLENTGLSLNGTGNKIILSIDKNLVLTGEGYALNVMENLITIQAPTPAGVFYGYQTLKQLMPACAYKKDSAPSAMEIQCVEIKDEPRFSWRGMMLDVGRHFMPVEDVKAFIDVLAMHKLNTLQWHLTEDQGWRIEIKKYPELTNTGAFRKETQKGWYSKDKALFDGIPHGGFYTQEEVKEIVSYAAERFVTVVPEIELPGHAQAAIASYPELGNTGEQLEVFTNWGVIYDVFNVNDSTIQFLKDVLDEVMELFPSTYIHIGGDECPKEQWEASPEAQQRIADEGLADEYELQSWFIRQFDEYLASKGRKLVGWDEILEGGLTDGATVMSWRGEEGGISAAKMGHDVVMTPTTYCYLDYLQAPQKNEPLAIGGNLPMEKVYSWNPAPKKIPEEFRKHVIGGQANLWTEYMKDMDQVLYMAWPRGAATAESLWTAEEKKNFAKFNYKLNKHYLRLAKADIPFRFPDTNISKDSFELGRNTSQVEITLPASQTGFYQLFVKDAKGAEINVESAELLVNGEVVDTHERKGLSTDSFSQSTVYTLSVSPDKAKDATVTARINLKSKDGKDAKATVLVKTL